MIILTPAGADSPPGLPVVVALHGLGGDALAGASALGPAMASPGLPRTVARGFAVITVDGGTTYWHRRADGDDPQGMIIHEVLPRAARLGLRTDRIGIVGNSMGGYGALLLAERLGPAPASGAPRSRPTAAAVAALSPAIFASYADAIRADQASFDGSADFRRNEITARLPDLRQVPAYVACGNDDPFAPAVSQLRGDLQHLTGHPPAGGIEPGCHDDAFWARHLPAALTFLAAHLLAPAPSRTT